MLSWRRRAKRRKAALSVDISEKYVEWKEENRPGLVQPGGHMRMFEQEGT